MISHKHKCIFVHIPKTGGSSINDVIWPRKKDRNEENLWMGFIDKYNNPYQTGGLQHLSASLIKQVIGRDLFENYFSFAVVRNPWDKAVSQYSFMQRRGDLREFIGMEKADSMKRYLELTQKKEHVQWKPQFDFVHDENGERIVEFLGRFEQLESDFDQVSERLNLRQGFFKNKKAKLPHTNKSERGQYRSYYDDESREMVADIYQKDIETFDYAF